MHAVHVIPQLARCALVLSLLILIVVVPVVAEIVVLVLLTLLSIARLSEVGDLRIHDEGNIYHEPYNERTPIRRLLYHFEDLISLGHNAKKDPEGENKHEVVRLSSEKADYLLSRLLHGFSHRCACAAVRAIHHCAHCRVHQLMINKEQILFAMKEHI